jgi:hypothetical protein
LPAESQHAHHRTEPGLDELKCHLFDEPLHDADGPIGRTGTALHPSTRLSETSRISFAAVDFELDLLRRRLAVWEIFGRHMKAGATSWPEVQRALTDDDLAEIVRICDGRTLRDLLVNLR